MTLKIELNKRNLKPRDVYYLFKQHLNINISERSFYNHIEYDFKRHEDEKLYRDAVKVIIEEYDKFLFNCSLRAKKG